MCGIAGSFGPDVLAPDRRSAALASLRHRGPDGQGDAVVSLPGGTVTLLHTRLAIIDLDPRAAQPMRRGPLTVAFNGEIYNYRELRAELRGLGSVFTTESDTEVLLAAYAQWGVAGLDRLEGMWAAALVDERDGSLLLTRDRFGKKPLFWSYERGRLLFASEVKALEAMLGRPCAVNLRQVRRFLVHGYRSLFKTGETFFQDVAELPAATFAALATPAPPKPVRYWTLRHAPDDNLTAAAVCDGVRARLTRSLDLRLRSDVPVAICLSGGVDSSALACLARKALGRDIGAFSVVDSDERYDESENLGIVVGALGCRHSIARTSHTGFFERMARLVASHDAPVATVSYYVHNFLSEHVAAAGYKVALSGVGADELFTGYYDHYAFWLAQRSGRADFASLVAAWRAGMGAHVQNPNLRDPALFAADLSRRSHLYQDRQTFNALLHDPITEDFDETVFSGDVLRNRMMNELMTEAVPVILREDDMNSMMFSVENRAPFLDRELVEFAYTIPGDLLIGDGLAKWPLRAAMDGVVPDRVRLDARKRGFNASIASLVDFRDPDTRASLLDDSAIYDVVDRARMKQFFDRDAADSSVSKFLFTFVSAKLFLDSRADASVTPRRETAAVQ
jgi:asparagine synthase (glutamine-hydrolysing)